MTRPFEPGNTGPESSLDERLTQALESGPAYCIPDGFAARIAGLAAERVSSRHVEALQTRYFSTLASQVTLAVLIVAMLLYALAAQKPSWVLTGSEILLALEFVALTTWLSLRPASRS